jgi:hypothetical protein
MSKFLYSLQGDLLHERFHDLGVYGSSLLQEGLMSMSEELAETGPDHIWPMASMLSARCTSDKGDYHDKLYNLSH